MLTATVLPLPRRAVGWALLAGLASIVCGRGAATADDGTLVKIVQLKHRQAADLAPVLQALAGAGGSVVALDSRGEEGAAAHKEIPPVAADSTRK